MSRTQVPIGIEKATAAIRTMSERTLNWTRVTRNVSALLRRKFVLLCRRWPSSRTLQCGMLGEVVVPVVKRPASREMILSCECTKRKG